MADLGFVIVGALPVWLFVPPGILPSFQSTRCPFPFSLGRQPSACPGAPCHRLIPSHVDHRSVGVEQLLVPFTRLVSFTKATSFPPSLNLVAFSVNEVLELLHGHQVAAYLIR